MILDFRKVQSRDTYYQIEGPDIGIKEIKFQERNSTLKIEIEGAIYALTVKLSKTAKECCEGRLKTLQGENSLVSITLSNEGKNLTIEIKKGSHKQIQFPCKSSGSPKIKYYD